jgi:CRP-like cAMP-binding protein
MTLAAARARAPSEDAWLRRELPVPPSVTEQASISEHLHRLRDYSMRLRFQRNETIFGQGDAATHIYTVISGCVRLCRHVPDGRRHVADFMFAGDVFGLGDRDTHVLAAEAVGSVTLTACPRSHFEHLGEGSSRLRAELLVHLSARLMASQQHLFVISCQSAKERLASFIVRMAERNNLYGDRLDLPMGRQDIADHLGLTIETICRAIAALRNGGTIDVPNAHQFVVKNMDVLRTLSDGRSSR